MLRWICGHCVLRFVVGQKHHPGKRQAWMIACYSLTRIWESALVLWHFWAFQKHVMGFQVRLLGLFS